MGLLIGGCFLQEDCWYIIMLILFICPCLCYVYANVAFILPSCISSFIAAYLLVILVFIVAFLILNEGAFDIKSFQLCIEISVLHLWQMLCSS